jgi:anti-sigma-K factor RskA
VDIQAYIQSGIIESYVLGVANADEAKELLRLAGAYPALKDAIRAAEETFEQNAMKNAITPNAGIKSNLLSTLQPDFAAPPVAPASETK